MAQFLLIHGASHGAWCWDRVVSALEARGHSALATDQPGLGDDTTPHDQVTWASTVEKLSNDLLQLDGPVILVAHSMGGTLAAQLAENHPEKVAAVVYVAATLPTNGESCLSATLADCSGSRIFFAFDELGITPEAAFALFPLLLFQDCPKADADLAMSRLGRQPMTVFDGAVSITEEREGTVPRYYVETLRDLVITPGAQREMYTRRPCERVYTLQTGHTPMYAAPEELAAILDDVAQARAEVAA